MRAEHAWVYRSDLALSTKGQTPRASLVHVTDERGRFICSALSSSSSQIALRAISHNALQNNRALYELVQERIVAAIRYREKIVSGTNAYRLVFSEGDLLGGLIIDRYADVFCLQILTQAMDRPDLRQAALRAVHGAFGPELNIVERVDERIRRLEELPPAESRLLEGEKNSTEFTLNGLRFAFDALTGQKTGAFLDQRENYAAAEAYAQGDALDVFCYQGGFALHLARKCRSVTGVDISRTALEGAEQNAALNAPQFTSGDIEWLEGNAFDLLNDYSHTGKLYETIVLDPPAFAKSKKSINDALRGYKEINLRALQMLRPGGVLITNSCSHHVSENDFAAMLAAASADAGRPLRIVEKRSQAKDHPVIATMPETAYLKCFICIAI